jgi:hypothetical protein
MKARNLLKTCFNDKCMCGLRKVSFLIYLWEFNVLRKFGIHYINEIAIHARLLNP